MSGTSGVDLGTAYGRIILDASGAQAGGQQAQRSLSGSLESIGGQIRNLGASLTLLTAPIVAFGAAGIQTFASFDDAMRELEARTGLGADEMERMRQAALDMGATTVFSATDAANSLLQLTTSGLSATEALEVLPAVLAGAAASGADLASVADWTTDIMAAYNLETSQASEVIEALNAAAGASSATFEDLAMGFQNVGGMAALMGLSVGDTAAILATFSENGIKGAEAGTQLRSMLTHMTSDVPEVTAMWSALGVSLYDIQGNARPLNDVILELSAAMDGMSDQERINVIQTLAGAYGQLGLSALLTSGGFGTMATSMDGAASAADVAAARMGGWSGTLEQLQGAIETLQIEALGPFIEGTLTPLIERVTEIVNQIAEWARANPELAGQIVEVVAALAVLGPTLIIIGQGISGVSTIVGLLGTAFTALTGPVGLAIAAGTALVAAYSTNFAGIRDFIDTEVAPRIQAFIDLLGNIWVKVQPALESLANWFTGEALPGIVAFITDTVAPAIQDVIDVLRGIWIAVQPALQSLGKWFTETGMPFIQGALQTVSDLVSGFIGVLGDIWTAVEPAVNALLNGLRPVFDAIMGVITPVVQAVNDLIGGLKRLGSEVNNPGGPVTATSGDAGTSFFIPAARALGGPVSGGLPYLVGEQGPELFVPRGSGSIVPNEGLRGMGGTTINIDVGGLMLAPIAGSTPQEQAGSFVDALEEELGRRGW